MRSCTIFLVFFITLIINIVNGDHNNHKHSKVHVAIYYESLCPDSIKFFTKQLYPSLQGNLSHYVNLTLLPFGKSTFKFDVNQYEFTCHHGPAECHGNKLQACAIHLIEMGRKTDNLGYNKITTGFINCLMDKVIPSGDNTDFPTKQCAILNSVQHLSDIENCANHPEGSNFLAIIGNLTMGLNPPLKSVPTIVFNNKYKYEDNDRAQNNFVHALCKYIDEPKPAECMINIGNCKIINPILTLLLSSTVTLVFLVSLNLF